MVSILNKLGQLRDELSVTKELVDASAIAHLILIIIVIDQKASTIVNLLVNHIVIFISIQKSHRISVQLFS